MGCAEERVRQLVGVGVPVASLPVDDLRTAPSPKLIAQGALDQYGPEDALLGWFAALPDPKHLEIIPQADHFLNDHLDELQHAVERYFKPADA